MPSPRRTAALGERHGRLTGTAVVDDLDLRGELPQTRGEDVDVAGVERRRPRPGVRLRRLEAVGDRVPERQVVALRRLVHGSLHRATRRSARKRENHGDTPGHEQGDRDRTVGVESSVGAASTGVSLSSHRAPPVEITCSEQGAGLERPARCPGQADVGCAKGTVSDRSARATRPNDRVQPVGHSEHVAR